MLVKSKRPGEMGRGGQGATINGADEGRKGSMGVDDGCLDMCW